MVLRIAEKENNYFYAILKYAYVKQRRYVLYLRVR